MDVVRKIADAVLYEGYILWPYRRSATKNQRRWTFGGAYPPSHSRVPPDDPADEVAHSRLSSSSSTVASHVGKACRAL